MKSHCFRKLSFGGSAPATPGFIAVGQQWQYGHGAAVAAPAIAAPESTLGSHPCVALSSAQVLPEWMKADVAVNAFAANGDNPLNFVSHSRGSLQSVGECWVGGAVRYGDHTTKWVADPCSVSQYLSCLRPNPRQISDLGVLRPGRWPPVSEKPTVQARLGMCVGEWLWSSDQSTTFASRRRHCL